MLRCRPQPIIPPQCQPPIPVPRAFCLSRPPMSQPPPAMLLLCPFQILLFEILVTLSQVLYPLKPILLQRIRPRPTIIVTAPQALRLHSLPTPWFHLPPTIIQFPHTLRRQATIHLYTPMLPCLVKVITGLDPLARTNPFMHQPQAPPPLYNPREMSIIRITNGGTHSTPDFISDVATQSSRHVRIRYFLGMFNAVSPSEW